MRGCSTNRYPDRQNPVSFGCLFLLVFILPILVSTKSPSSTPNQQQYFSYLGIPFQEDQNHTSYQNLFSQFKQINVTSRLYTRQTPNKQATLSLQSTTLILESDYLKMYKNKLNYQINLHLTPQILTAIKANHTFLETAFYFVKNHKTYLIEKQVIPFMASFSHQWREGFQHFMIADIELLEKKAPQIMILKQMDVYFFEIDHELIFSREFQGSQAFGVVQAETPEKKATDFYYPRPLATKINSRLKQNYVSLSTLEQNVNTNNNYKIKVNIKIGSYLFPLMMHTFQALNQGAQDLTFEIQGVEFGIQDHLELAQPFIIRYFKKVLFQGSFFGWTFLILQTFITLSSKLVSFAATLFQLQIFRNAIQYRGMSLYSTLMFLLIDFVLIILYGYLRTGYLLGPLVSFLIGIWKITKMGNIQISLEFPYLQFEAAPWYAVYSEKDKKSFILCVGPILLFVLIVMGYPIAFQEYLSWKQQMSESLERYMMERFVLAINQYRFMLGIFIQIIVNCKLKSCNSIPWKYLISLILFFSVDNSLIPVTTSIWEFLFFLKQEILLGGLILQKLVYGNNLSLLPYQQQTKQQNNPVDKPEQAIGKQTGQQQEASITQHNRQEMTKLIQQHDKTQSQSQQYLTTYNQSSITQDIHQTALIQDSTLNHSSPLELKASNQESPSNRSSPFESRANKEKLS